MDNLQPENVLIKTAGGFYVVKLDRAVRQRLRNVPVPGNFSWLIGVRQ